MFVFISDDENYRAMDAERRLRYQMSSGFGTQHNDSKDEPTYAESFELRTICPTNSTETDPEAPLLRRTDSEETEAYLQYQKSLLTRSPSYRKSLDRISIISTKSSENSPQDTVKKAISDREINEHTDRPVVAFSSIQIVDELSRRPSDQSVNTLSNDHDEYMIQSNLRDELLNCEQKDLFQFLSDDFDNSNNYFSETVGFGNTVIDPDTDSLVLDSKNDDFDGISPLPTRRKTSGSSIRSNFSYLSGSIFSALEQKRGGSISESVDRRVINAESDRNSDDHEPLMKDSEFENIIASFEKELNEIKKSTASLNRNISVESYYSDGKLGNDKRSSIHSNQNVLPRHRTVDGSVKSNDNDSVKIKRRSLEKQSKIDDGFSVSNEIRKICDNMQAPFSDSNSTNTQISPVMRRKTDFQTSFDRIKRTSLIERVDESADENNLARTHQVLSEKLPRKYLAADMQLDSISLKSTGSYEHLIFDRENQTKLPQKTDETTKLMESEPEKGETVKHVSYDQSKSPGKQSKMGEWFVAQLNMGAVRKNDVTSCGWVFKEM